MLDVDGFKSCNDAHGHLAGDEVLAQVARAIRVELRHVDLFGRYGGDEFVVLLDGAADPASAAAAGERLRSTVADLRVVLANGRVLSGLSVSIGVVVFAGRDGVAGVAELIGVADRAMYLAKRAGGDGVRVVDVGELNPVGTRIGAGHG